MSQRNNPGSEFSRDREFKVVLENIYGQFKVFGEGMQDVQSKLLKIDGRLDRIETRLDRIELRLDAVEYRVDRMEGKLDQVEGRLNVLEKDVSFIKMALPTIATKDEIKFLDRRITFLETSH